MNNGTKILVVEDDHMLVEAIRIILESEGFDVVAANDAKRGLEKAEAERPALILLDVMMPDGTEGFHFVWNLRQREEPYFQKVPIIVLSAIHEKTTLRFYPDSSDGTYKGGEYLPVQDFLDKPLNPPKLLETVRHVLGATHQG